MTDPRPSNLDYIFYPSRSAGDPGHPRMDITLTEEPREGHFDPVQVQFPAVTGRDEIRPLTVEHPWTLQPDYRVTAGRVTLRNRRGKAQSAFTYGGELKIETRDRQTTCILTSEAPILNLTVEHSLANLLAVETEALLAERRAAWAHAQEGYEKRLSELEPARLFSACAAALYARFHKLPYTGDELTARFVHYLNTVQRTPQGRGDVGRPASLEEIL